VFAVKVRMLVQRKLLGNGSFSEQDLRFMVSDLMTSGNTPTSLELCCTCLLTVLTSQHIAANKTSELLGVVFSRLRRDAVDGTLAMMTSFMRRHLAASPFVDVALVEDAMTSFRMFHLWPKPICTIALSMLQSLTMETKSPGVTWRRSLEEAFPSLQQLPGTGYELSSLVFAAPDSALASVLESVAVRVPSEREVTAAAVIALFQSMGIGESECEEGQVAEEPKLEFLSLKKLRGVYAKVRACLEQGIQMASSNDAMAFIIARMGHLYRALLKHVSREQARCKGETNKFYCFFS
jgi:hypothetical protein